MKPINQPLVFFPSTVPVPVFPYSDDVPSEERKSASLTVSMSRSEYGSVWPDNAASSFTCSRGDIFKEDSSQNRERPPEKSRFP